MEDFDQRSYSAHSRAAIPYAGYYSSYSTKSQPTKRQYSVTSGLKRTKKTGPVRYEPALKWVSKYQQKMATWKQPKGTKIEVVTSERELMWNVKGSSECDCFKDDEGFQPTWIQLYKDYTNVFPKMCSFHSCREKFNLVGGHLKFLDSKVWYIVPICSSCNNTSKNNEVDYIVKGTKMLKLKCSCPK
jgi:hypothetical protein